MMVRAGVGGRRLFVILGIASLAYTCLMFIWFSLPAFLSVIMAELALSGTQAGIVVGAIPLTYIPLALVSGVIVDRIGPGRSLAVGVLCFGLAQIGRSAAIGFGSILLLTILIGIGATVITFGLPKLVSVLFPPEQTGFPSSIYLLGAQLGSVLVFGLGRPVLGPILGGWRPLFFWSGVVAVGYAIGWYLLARWARVDASSPGLWGVVSRQSRTGNRSESESSGDTGLGSVRQDLRVILTHRELQLVVVIGTMYLLINHSVKGWLPTILESGSFSPALAGQITTLYVVGMVVGIFGIPTIADRLERRRMAITASGAIVMIGLAGLFVGGDPGLTTVAVFIAGIGTGGLSPMIRAIPPELDGIGAKRTGAAVGFVFAVGEIGGFLGPVMVGALNEWTGTYIPGLFMLIGAGVVVAVAGLLLKRMEMDPKRGE